MTIVDVRSEAEFAGGHVEGSLNIPLQAVPNRVEEFRNLSKPLYLCCASGNRSGQAAAFLISNGIECTNAGSWQQAQRHTLELQNQ